MLHHQNPQFMGKTLFNHYTSLKAKNKTNRTSLRLLVAANMFSAHCKGLLYKSFSSCSVWWTSRCIKNDHDI